MGRIPKVLEVCANIGIIIVSVLLTIAIVRSYFFNRPPPQNSPDNGFIELNQLSSLDINWKNSQQTLILAISNTCRYCTESAPFYRRLASGKGNTQLVAILPQSLEQGSAYLNQLGISVDEIREFRLDRIGVQGTPTIILVDRSGIVKKTWVGKLSPQEELAVLNTLRGT